MVYMPPYTPVVGVPTLYMPVPDTGLTVSTRCTRAGNDSSGKGVKEARLPCQKGVKEAKRGETEGERPLS